MCCTRRYRRPTNDGRKKVSGPGKFCQESGDCRPGSFPESVQRARQLAEATSAALTDPFLELTVAAGSSPFWQCAHNPKPAQGSLLPPEQGSRHGSLEAISYIGAGRAKAIWD